MHIERCTKQLIYSSSRQKSRCFYGHEINHYDTKHPQYCPAHSLHGYGTLGPVTSQRVHEQIELCSRASATRCCDDDASSLRHQQQQHEHYGSTSVSAQAQQMGSTGRAGALRCYDASRQPTTDAATTHEDDSRLATLPLNKHKRCLAGRMASSPDDALLCNLANETLIMLQDKTTSS